MAHILWIILKIILIILAVLLGLVVLAVLLILFCPVCYKASVTKNEGTRLRDTDASVYVQWLFRAVSVKAGIEHGKTGCSIRLFGIPLDKILHRSGKKKPKAAPKESLPAAEEFREEKVPEQTAEELREEKVPEQTAEEIREEKVPAQETEEIPEDTAFDWEEDIPQEEPSEATEVQEEAPSGKGSSKKTRREDKPKRKKGGKISGFFRSLKKKISGAVEKIRVLSQKAGWWKDFITDERTGFAIECVLGELKKIVRHILPRKSKGHARFGAEDPSVTGRILAVCGMALPLHKNRIALEPVFEERDILDVDAQFRGRIYGIRFIVSAVIILLNKDVRFVYNTLKHKEE